MGDGDEDSEMGCLQCFGRFRIGTIYLDSRDIVTAEVFLHQVAPGLLAQCVNSARHLYVFQFSEFDFWNSFIVFLWSYM